MYPVGRSYKEREKSIHVLPLSFNGAERLLFINRVFPSFLLFFLFGLFYTLPVSVASADVLYSLEFSGQPDGPAEEWLKRQGFIFRFDADDLQPRFKNNRLVLQTTRKIGGLFELSLNLSNAKRLRIHWGVDRYPRGADWGERSHCGPHCGDDLVWDKKNKQRVIYRAQRPVFRRSLLRRKRTGQSSIYRQLLQKGRTLFLYAVWRAVGTGSCDRVRPGSRFSNSI